jgi:hypothetical protein
MTILDRLLRRTTAPASVNPDRTKPRNGPDLPPITLFRDILIQPSTTMIDGGDFVDGGPVWPDLDQQVEVRHRKGQRFRDEPARANQAQPTTIQRPCIWGGYARNHFGHLVAENLTRILTSLHQRPDDPVLFITHAGRGRNFLKPYFWQLCAWYGLPEDRIRIIHAAPARVSELRVMPQAEYLDGPAPSVAYLDLLNQNERRNGLQALPNNTVYVGRPGMIDIGKGGHAGETYLIALLSDLGIPCLDPGTAPLHQQLALYAGAKHLIFAEGSALHGRQLLGRHAQKITVLNRRLQHRTAEPNLRPRVDDLTYAEAAIAELFSYRPDGGPQIARTLAIYDLPLLFSALQAAGIDLSKRWDMAEYRAAQAHDVTAWLTARAEKLTEKSLTEALPVLQREGLSHLLDAMASPALPSASLRQGR